MKPLEHDRQSINIELQELRETPLDQLEEEYIGKQTKRRKGRPHGKSRGMRKEPPSRSELEQNLMRINELLGIDETDYGEIDSEELKRRLESRMEEQDKIKYPQRLAEGQVSPEWRKYIRKRV